MISYSLACEQVGYNPGASCPKDIVFLAYKDGVCKQFATMPEAKMFSKLVEMKVTNADTIKMFHSTQRDLESKAYEVWLKELREYCVYSDNISVELFEVCFAQAWIRFHSSGLDEVANGMEDIIDFALSARKAK